MQHPDEGMIHTWLDGELPAEDAAALETHVAECEECAALVAEARGFVAATSRIVSALDAVPRGVIPIAKPVRRPWYATNQFRAAAALLLVAGTSLVVVRGSRQPSEVVVANKAVAVDAAERANPPMALAMPKPESVQPQAQSATSAPPASALQSPPSTMVGGKALEASGEIGRSRQRSDVAKADDRLESIVAAKEVAADAVKPSDILAQKPEARRIPFGGTNASLNEVVVTGLSIANESDAALKVISSDSTATTKRTVIEVSPNVQVTLTEANASGFAAGIAQANADRSTASPQRAAKSLPQAPMPVPSPMVTTGVAAEMAKKAEVHTITWVDSATGRTYSLTGPLPVEKLEALKPKVVKLKR